MTMTPSTDIGLYIHVPFCRQRCHFCAFYLEIAQTRRVASYRDALAKEIALHHRQETLGNRPLETIYFGGGTPTAIPVGHLISILDLARTTWPTSMNVEITVEAHPSTVTARGLKALVDAGFNRLSLGAESMNDRDFAHIGRPGTTEGTRSAMAAARSAGFSNINLDLMFGLPGQSLSDWRQTLQSVLALEPSHVSCYALTVEEGTRLAADMARGAVERPDESIQVEMQSVAEAVLVQAGFVRYEISNFARPGAACRHNLLYWTDQDYLGLGPSAQSYVNGVRFGNVADLSAYVEQLAATRLPITERAILSISQRQREALVFGLRLLRGVSSKNVQDSEQCRRVKTLITQGLLQSADGRVRLTPLGQRYADTVAGELF
jgi:oxygen-independent coproporphyrinogen-3 oxidase